ncbi:hypothetical protein BJY01DRAFT_256615 [Aspergillus pseudoustus]|uniref:MADS-box domain-containing protein n=1 Tax=Aspergillus pseudoustus TaxID=1810923 RepID=A0ABR4I6V2_9EURO
MPPRRERDQERRRVKNSRERLKRRKERVIRNLHDYGLLSGARIFVVIQENTGDLIEYQNMADKKFPPSYTRLRQLFPARKFLTPESFGATIATKTSEIPTSSAPAVPPAGSGDPAIDFSALDMMANFDPFEAFGFPGGTTGDSRV